MKRFAKLVLAAVTLSVATSARAGVITYTQSFPLTDTNWSADLSFPKFDPSLGQLTSIQFSLGGFVTGTAAYESLDSEPSDVTLKLQASERLFRPDNSQILITIPTVSALRHATAFDDELDFAGTSGETLTGLSGTASNSVISKLPADLALFTASFAGQTISLPATAAGESTIGGSGNLAFSYQTQASATASVNYTFAAASSPGGPPTFAAVPEPAGSTMLVAAGALVLTHRRRRVTV